MIGVVVGEEDMGELPVLLFQLALDRPGLGRVEQRGRAGFPVMDEKGVVVGEAGDRFELESHPVWSPWLDECCPIARGRCNIRP